MDRERIREYLISLESAKDAELARLRADAENRGIPILKEETESLLLTLLKLKRPERVLEIGTAVGYSAIVMARASDAYIVTIENYEKRVKEAEKNILSFGLTKRIELKASDAGEALRELCDRKASFDLIFLDAAKGQYIRWLPYIKRLMPKGSVLVSDNVFLDYTVLESRYTVERRERTTHKRMRDFLHEIKHDEELQSAVLPIGDGVSISVKL